MAQKIDMTQWGDPTLCMPDSHKSCFACCPPIRPQGYEHLPYRGSLKRMLRENTAGFDPGLDQVRPIRGYSCWGLGYLDPEYRLIGCLLHPARNNGVDLRYRVDYWDKCRRENCPESRTFLLLAPAQRRFWLRLSEGLDSFAYSSRKENPLFNLLGWGEPILAMIAEEAGDEAPSSDSFFAHYPFFTTGLAPKGNAYLLRRVVAPGSTHLLKEEGFKTAFETLSKEISDSVAGRAETLADTAPTHLLGLERDLLDFLRLHLQIPRISPHEALRIKQQVDHRIERFSAS